jgi:hypothetical protein
MDTATCREGEVKRSYRERPMPTIHFYGPTEALNKKIFKMPDFELAN